MPSVWDYGGRFCFLSDFSVNFITPKGNSIWGPESIFGCLIDNTIYGIILTVGRMEKIIERMRNNPRDWRITDLETLASYFGISIRKHGDGSHVVFYHPKAKKEVTEPAHKPVKPIYVKKLLAMIDNIKE